MSNQRTVNTDERIREIRERQPDSWRDRADIDFLLSLVDSQAVSTDVSVLTGYEAGFNDAATRMRDKCVEAGKQCVFAEAVRLGIGAERAIALSSKVMTAIESLTLDQVEKQEQGK